MLPDPALLFQAVLFNHNDKAAVLQSLIDYGVDVLAQSEGKTALDLLDQSASANKTDPSYLEARSLLEKSIEARKATLSFITTSMDRLNQAPLESQAAVLKSTFIEAMTRYASDPHSIELRSFLLSFANRGLPSPAPPPEALVHEQVAQAVYAKAQTRSDMLTVTAEYEQAARIAPWVGAYTRNLCTLYELSGSYGRASRDCRLYLSSNPPEQEEMSQQLQRLQGKTASIIR